MKPIKSVLVAALAATCLAVTAGAQAAHGGGGGGSHGGGHYGGGGHSGGGHYGGGHYGGGHYGGGHYGGFWGSGVGLYFGAPLLFSPWYWGYPYDYYPYDYYYPRAGIVGGYVEPYPASYPDGVMQPAPTTEVPRTEGAPSQAPAYMNYCESAKAYFPKVTSCPEGWKFLPAR
jgi:hypothetical protein